MKLINLMVALCISTALLFTACADSAVLAPQNDTLNNIPNDGTVASVTAIDVDNLMTKMDFDYVKGLDFYQDLLTEVAKEDKLAAKVLENPAASGIDLSQKIYLANRVDPLKLGEMMNYATVSIKDKVAFEKLLDAADLGDIQSKEGFQMIEIGRKNIVAWNNKIAILGNATGYPDMPAIVAQIFNMDKTDSISKNADLRQSLSGNHDIASWINSNPYAENPDAKMGSELIGVNAEALKDNFMHTHLDFENGEATGTSAFFLQKGLTKDLDLLFKDNVKTNFGKYIPSDNLAFEMTAALDFKGLNQVLAERPQAKAFADFRLKEFGLTLGDMFKAFGGDIAVAIYPSKDGKNSHGLFMTNIDNNEMFDKVLKVGTEFGMLKKQSDDVYELDRSFTRNLPKEAAIGNGEAKLFIIGDMVYITGSDLLMATIQGGNFVTGEGISGKASNLMNRNIFSSVLDFNILKKYSKEMENFDGTDLEIKVNRKKADMNMQFEDKNTNSLKQIFKMINEQYLKDKNKGSKAI